MKLFNNKKKEFSFDEAFRANLKYISNSFINSKDIDSQFVDNRYVTVGNIDIISGRVVVSDPLAYLPTGKFSPTLDVIVPNGKYRVEVSVINNKYIGIRMCTVRLKIRDSSAVRYEIANSIKGTACFEAKDGDASGFPVDAGMVTICDEEVAKEYQKFIDSWHLEHPNGNHYDDYFAKIFKDSYDNNPKYQRSDGDFIEWTIPGTNHNMVMIASGLGDGLYQSFIGYDKDGDICDIIIPMINPKLFE